MTFDEAVAVALPRHPDVEISRLLWDGDTIYVFNPDNISFKFSYGKDDWEPLNEDDKTATDWCVT